MYIMSYGTFDEHARTFRLSAAPQGWHAGNALPPALREGREGYATI